MLVVGAAEAAKLLQQRLRDFRRSHNTNNDHSARSLSCIRAKSRA